MRAAIVAILMIATTARANVWEHASEPHEQGALDDVYEKLMSHGDELTARAKTASSSITEVRRLIQEAVDAYRTAAKARPSEGEPWYRIGMVLHRFFFDCEAGPMFPQPSLLCALPFDRKRAEEVIAAWDELEKRAPLDPRLSFTSLEGAHVLFERAILHTKLIDLGDGKTNRAHLEAAARDYQKVIARFDSSDSSLGGFFEECVGNLAETLMMLGRLDDSIDMYREALRHGATASTSFGFAVALDRDDRGDEAREHVIDLGDVAAQQFHQDVQLGRAFFVPKGEVYYYFALIDEANGRFSDALGEWELFIKSGAHPEFQPRARQHLDAIRAKHIRREVPHLDWLDE